MSLLILVSLAQYHTYLLSRALALVDWKAKNEGVDEKKFQNYWNKLPTEDKEVCRTLRALSYLTLGALDQAFYAREKELVRYSRLRYLL